MEVFDQPAALTTCARRDTSTHAPQSLELLNGDISNDLAARFAGRPRQRGGRRPRATDRASLPVGRRASADRGGEASRERVLEDPAPARVRACGLQPQRFPLRELIRAAREPDQRRRSLEGGTKPFSRRWTAICAYSCSM